MTPAEPAAAPEPPEGLVEQCEAPYYCTPCGHYQAEYDLRRVQGRCVFDFGVVLQPGGGAVNEFDSTRRGHWVGNSESFQLEIKNACFMAPDFAEDIVNCRKKY